MKTASNPAGQTVIFNESAHTYTCGKTQLESGTTFVGRFFPKFESDKVATIYAKKRKLKKADVLAMWAAKGEAASAFGNKIHEYAEQVVKGESHKIKWEVSERESRYRMYVDMALHKIEKDFKFMEPEMIIFSEKLGKAGMLDLPTTDKKNNDLVIWDWKVNEKIEKENFWQNCLHPISHLQAAKFNKYQLQLNFYNKICEVENYYDVLKNRCRMGLIHLTETGPVFLKVENMRGDIDNMLAWGDI